MSVQVTGFATEGVLRNYEVGGIPLLQTFYLRFTSGDRHIQAIVIEPDAPHDKISIMYYDDSRNDEFFYRAGSYSVSATDGEAHKIEGFAAGSEPYELSSPGPEYEFVLVGFSFFYPGGDHEMNEIGILENDGLLTVSFNHKNDDDLFRYEVEYAWVQNSRIRNKGEETGSRARGADARSIPQGIRVIRGFKLDFEPYFTSGNDHHLNDIGVLTSGSTSGDLEVYYSDRNRDDGFDWEVRWATIRPLPSDILPLPDFEARPMHVDRVTTARFADIEPGRHP